MWGTPTFDKEPFFVMKKRAPEEKLLLVPACQSKQGETLLERRQDNGKENRFCDNADRALEEAGIQQVHHGCVEEYAQPVGVEDEADADLGKEDRKQDGFSA